MKRLERLRERAEALARSIARDPAETQAAETQATESRSLQETFQYLAAGASALLKVTESHERWLGDLER